MKLLSNEQIDITIERIKRLLSDCNIHYNRCAELTNMAHLATDDNKKAQLEARSDRSMDAEMAKRDNAFGLGERIRTQLLNDPNNLYIKKLVRTGLYTSEHCLHWVEETDRKFL